MSRVPSVAGSALRSGASLVAIGLGLLIAVVFLGESPAPEEEEEEVVVEPAGDAAVPSEPLRASPEPDSGGSRASRPPDPESIPTETVEETVVTSTYADTVRESFRAALEALGHTPHEGALLQMTEAALKIRAARAAFSRIGYEPGRGQEVRRLRDEIAQAGADFEAAAGMSLSELTARTTEGGISPSTGDQPEKDVVFEFPPQVPQ